MSVRSSSTPSYSGYSAQADQEWNEYQLAKVCYICGLDGSTATQYSIDSIIEAINNVFCTSTTSSDKISRVENPDGTLATFDFVVRQNAASTDWVLKRNTLTSLVARRASRRHRLATYQGSL